MRGPGALFIAAWAEALEGDARQQAAGNRPPPTLREFITSPDYFGLSISPVIAAIADASQGIAITTIAARLCEAIFKCAPEELPRARRRQVAVSGGGRGGKTSRLLAPAAVYYAIFTPLRAPAAPVDPRYPNAAHLSHGERAAALLIAPKRKLARQAMSMIRGGIQQSPFLSPMVVESKAESIVLRRPDGIEIEIAVTTADRGGASARSRTLVFMGLDEASFFAGMGFAVNDEDVFSAGIQRVVPYGQAWVVSTPWVEGEGLLERFVASDWGSHGETLVAARVGTRLLNPSWDPDGDIERTERARPGGVENADREILAIPLPRGTSQFFPQDAIKRACEILPEGRREERGAGVDLGHGHDNSALAICDRHAGGVFAPARVQEIHSGPEQAPSETYRAFIKDLVAYGCSRVAADPHYKATFEEQLRKHGIAFEDAKAKDAIFLAGRALLVDGRLALGGLEPAERDALVAELSAVVSKPLAGGRIQILPPRRKVGDAGANHDGHCDSVYALMVALSQCGSLEPFLWGQRQAKAPPRQVAPQRAGGSGVNLDWLRERSAGRSSWYGRGR